MQAAAWGIEDCLSWTSISHKPVSRLLPAAGCQSLTIFCRRDTILLTEILVAPSRLTNHNARGNGVCLPAWENRLNGFSADNSCWLPAIVEAVGFMWNAFWIFIGSGLGGLARWGASSLIANRFGQTFPWGTLVVNVTGSFAIGLFATLTAPEGRWLVRPTGRDFFMTGICGGYTTFSSFSYQTLTLAQDKEWLYAGGNVVLNITMCMGAVWAGHAVAQLINSTRGT
jgi:CrcB protein